MRSSNGLGLDARLPSRITLAIDAGGTFLKGAILVNGEFLSDSLLKRPSESQSPASSIIASFAGTCLELLDFYTSTSGPLNQHDTLQIGFAFPGPFDYEEGIALLQGIGKYEALYQLSVRDLLSAEFQKIRASTSGNLADALATADIRFGNDAFMFGLGISPLFLSERLICLTLGTGLGSSFIENGHIIQGKNGVPSNGMLFAEPYRDSVIDNYFGRREILRMASERGILWEKSDVADLAAAARNGDVAAQDMFHEYGYRLGEMLLPYVAFFNPHRIVLGGQISNSFPLWETDIQNALGETLSLPIQQIQDEIIAVFQGINKLFKDTDQPFIHLV